jgi:hypothetical protein
MSPFQGSFYDDQIPGLRRVALGKHASTPGWYRMPIQGIFGDYAVAGLYRNFYQIVLPMLPV